LLAIFGPQIRGELCLPEQLAVRACLSQRVLQREWRATRLRVRWRSESEHDQNGSDAQAV
jgi:hypothetical protein